MDIVIEIELSAGKDIVIELDLKAGQDIVIEAPIDKNIKVNVLPGGDKA